MTAPTDTMSCRVRSAAEFECAAAAESRSKTIDEHNAAFRWLLASLFGLNGAVMAALISSDRLSASELTRAAPWFLAGIIFTFGMAIFGQLSDRRFISLTHRWGLYWSEVKVTCSQDPSREESIKWNMEAAERLGRRGRVCGLISMLMFVVGCGFAFVGLAW